MRTMHDSVTATDIPATATMVGGYVDGDYVWSAADWARFPAAVHVPIAVFSTTNNGVVLDVERGNATPAQSVDWVRLRRAAGVDPTVYCNLATLPLVQGAFRAAYVTEPHYWLAQWTGAPHLLAGSVATQYADPTTSGGHWDLSLVADHWPGVDPAAPHPAPPPPSGHVYVVQDRDTLSGIGVRFGVPWQAIWDANRVVIGSNPDLIRPGERLVIPLPTLHTYVVQAGDDLSGIAARLGIPWPTLYADNRAAIGADPDVIHPGLVLHW